jgi:hypothetical protein
MLTNENKIWVESAAQRLQIRPESLVNGVLRQLRTELGSLEDGKSLESWLKKSESLHENLESISEQARETLRVVEETIKATQLYLNQIQRSQKNALG